MLISTHLWLASIRSFLADRRGVSAVEAAILAPIFIPLLIFAFELLLFMFTSSSLDNALKRSVQEMRLGTASSSASAKKWTAEEYYRQSICANMFVPKCVDNIKVSLETYDANGIQTATFNNRFVGASTLVYVEAQIEVPVAAIMRLTSQGDRIVVKSSHLIKTEPF